MAKFNVSPGVGAAQQQRIDVIDKLARTQQQAQPDLPVQPQPTPDIDTSDPLVASLVADGELTPTDLSTEAFGVGATLTPEQQVQREEERIAPLSERVKPVDRAIADWEPFQAQQDRANNLLSALDYESEGARVKSGFVPTSALEASQNPAQELQTGLETEAFTQPEEGPTSFLEAFTAAEAGAPVAREQGGGGKFQFDPLFAWVASAATERFFAEGKQDLRNDTQADFADFDEEAGADVESVSDDLQVSRSLGNARLGRQVWEEWQREQAARDGVPSDEYLLTKKAPSKTDLEYIGGTLKEAYAAANPDMIERPMGTGRDDAAYFLPTRKFLNEYAKFKEAAAAPFDNTNEVPPLNQPPANLESQPQFEAKLRTRAQVTKIADQVDPNALDLMNESRGNLSRMGFKVDGRAEKMIFTMGPPALSGAIAAAQAIGPDEQVNDSGDMYKEYWSLGSKAELYQALGITPEQEANARYMGIGVDRLFSIFGDKRRLLAEATQANIEHEAAKQAGENEGAIAFKRKKAEEALEAFNQFRPVKVYRQELAKFGDEMDALARYGNQVNHFTFSIQMLTGRQHVQQNKLNPQSKKIQRFALRQADQPVLVNPNRGGVIEQNFKEIVAVSLLGGKSLHKGARLEAFDKADLSGYVAMGNQLVTMFEGADVSNPKEAILNKDIATLQQSAPVAIPADIQRELDKHKAEEAPYVMELLMDLAKWDRAQRTNTKFYTTYEAEMDGIAHGVTSNGAALGVENTMIRGGVYHADSVQKQVSPENDIVGDITKEMAAVMQHGAQETVTRFGKGADEQGKFLSVLSLAVQDRANFLKKAPMTFVYGQELKNLREHVKATLYTGDMADAIAPYLDAGIDVTQLENFLLQVMQNSLVELLSAESVQVSRQLRANNVLATLTGIPLYYDNAMGFRNWIGNVAEDATFESPLGFAGTEGTTTPKQADVRHYRDVIHGAAPRHRGIGREQIGGWGHGRIIPSVVQSYDGNMIAKTSSGDSIKRGRDKARSRGHKYGFLPIFDAFKTNLANIDIVREEANKNWWDGIQDKNFVEDIMGPDGWTQDVFKFLRDTGKGNQPVNIFEGQFRGVGAIFADPDQLTLMIEATFPYKTKDELTNTAMIKKDAKRKAENVWKVLKAKGIDRERFAEGGNETLSPDQLLTVIREITKTIDLYNTNAALSRTINKKRGEAFSKVRQQATPISQIDIG